MRDMSDKKRNETPFERAVNIMATLRAPGGCPWDREQTHKSLRRHLLEETYEVLEAIDKDDFNSLEDELGDLILQVLFHAELANEKNIFNIDDVLNRLCDKLIRRHPHIFGTTKVDTSQEVVKKWEEIKIGEVDRKSRLAGIPRDLPSLLFSTKLQEKAARAGFDWKQKEKVYEKIEEEISELKDADIEKGDIEHELGDVLFAIVNLSRHIGVDPESALRRCNERFTKRFQSMENSAGNKLESLNLDEMDLLWERAKQEEKKSE